MLISYQNYYMEVYQLSLRYPKIFTIRTGENTYVPIELCQVVPSQVYRKKLAPRDQQEFLRISKRDPAERFDMIQRAAVRRLLFDREMMLIPS